MQISEWELEGVTMTANIPTRWRHKKTANILGYRHMGIS
jgi:hypothetical protein